MYDCIRQGATQYTIGNCAAFSCPVVYYSFPWPCYVLIFYLSYYFNSFILLWLFCPRIYFTNFKGGKEGGKSPGMGKGNLKLRICVKGLNRFRLPKKKAGFTSDPKNIRIRIRPAKLQQCVSLNDC